MNKFHIIKNFLTEKECFDILTKCKSEIEMSPARIGSGVVTKVRKSSVGFINDIEIIDEKLKKTLRDLIKIKGYEVTNLGKYQFTEYNVGEYYNWHTDSSKEEYKDRFCSIVIQLSDNYEGGNLQLRDENDEIIEFERGVGNIYIFHSNMTHRVTPITEGVRYSLVNWISLKKLEDIKKTLI